MPAISIRRFTDRVVANYEGRCASSTTRQVKQVLRELSALKTKQGKPLVKRTSDLTDGAVNAWIKAYPDRTPVTLKSHLRCLSSLCTRAVKSGWLKLDPFDVDSIADWVRSDSRPAPPKRQWSRSPDDIRRVHAGHERGRQRRLGVRAIAGLYLHALSAGRPSGGSPAAGSLRFQSAVSDDHDPGKMDTASWGPANLVETQDGRFRGNSADRRSTR